MTVCPACLPTSSLETRGCNPHPEHDLPQHITPTSRNGEDPERRENGKQKLRRAKVTAVSVPETMAMPVPKTTTARWGSCLRLTRLSRGLKIT